MCAGVCAWGVRMYMYGCAVYGMCVWSVRCVYRGCVHEVCSV